MAFLDFISNVAKNIQPGIQSAQTQVPLNLGEDPSFSTRLGGVLGQISQYATDAGQNKFYGDMMNANPDYAQNYFKGLNENQQVKNQAQSLIDDRMERMRVRREKEDQKAALATIAKSFPTNDPLGSALSQFATVAPEQGIPALFNYQTHLAEQNSPLVQMQIAKAKAEMDLAARRADIFSGLMGGGMTQPTTPQPGLASFNMGAVPIGAESLDAGLAPGVPKSPPPPGLGQMVPPMGPTEPAPVIVQPQIQPIPLQNKAAPSALENIQPVQPQTQPQFGQDPNRFRQLGMMLLSTGAQEDVQQGAALLSLADNMDKANFDRNNKINENETNLEKQESDLRKEFETLPDVKEFRAQERAYQAILAGAQDLSGPGSISAIFNFMKSLDPTSTVREGEYATASNAGGIPTWVRNSFNKAKDGNGLTPELRDQFIQQAYSQIKSQSNLFQSRVNEYRALANEYGFKPDRVIKGPRVDLKMPEKISDRYVELKGVTYERKPDGTFVKVSK